MQKHTEMDKNTEHIHTDEYSGKQQALGSIIGNSHTHTPNTPSDTSQ